MVDVAVLKDKSASERLKERMKKVLAPEFRKLKDGGEGGDRIAKAYDERAGRMEQDAANKLGMRISKQASLAEYRDFSKGYPVMGALCHALIRSHVAKEFSPENVAERMAKHIPAPLVEKTLNLSTPGEGALFVEGPTLQFFYDVLRPNIAVLSRGPRTMPLVDGHVTLTGWETRSVMTWVGEVNDQEIISEPTEGARQLDEKYGMIGIPISDALRNSRSGMAIANQLEEHATMAITEGFDIVYITGAGNQFRPTGLRNWALAGGQVASAGDGILEVLQDYRDAWAYFDNNNIPQRNMGQIFHPRDQRHFQFGIVDGDGKPFFREEVQAGSFLGLPFSTTTNVPNNLGGGNESYTIIADFAEVIVGQGEGLELRWFDQASFEMGGNVIRPAQSKVTWLRGTAGTDMAVPHPEAVYVLTGTTRGTAIPALPT